MASFLNSLKTDTGVENPPSQGSDGGKNLSDAEVRLIRDAVADLRETAKEKGKKAVLEDPAPSMGPTDAVSSIDEPKEFMNKNKHSEDENKDDQYHKPGEGGKYTPKKHIPWFWVVILVIVAIAILYSWYDYTKETNARKDVRAFVAGIMIVVTLVLLYLLLR